ncbi:unnamed protein product [Amoebophrya sp. A25]|nr:unnamed protein product [Amoebophrya sp. A25]|eukprot:GSA25T00012601001.1
MYDVTMGRQGSSSFFLFAAAVTNLPRSVAADSPATTSKPTRCLLQWFRTGRPLTIETCPDYHAYGEASSAEHCCHAGRDVPDECDVRYRFKIHDKHLSRANAAHHCCDVAKEKVGISWSFVATKYGCQTTHSWFDWSGRSPCLAEWWDTNAKKEVLHPTEYVDSAGQRVPTDGRVTVVPNVCRDIHPYPDQQLWASSVGSDEKYREVMDHKVSGFKLKTLVDHCCAILYVPDNCDVRYRLNYHDKMFKEMEQKNDHFCCLSEDLFVARAYGCMHYGSGLLMKWEPDAESLHVGLTDLFSIIQRPILEQLWTTPDAATTTSTAISTGNRTNSPQTSAKERDDKTSSSAKLTTIAEMLAKCTPTPYELHRCESRCAYSTWGLALADIWGYVKLEWKSPGMLYGATTDETWWYLTELRERAPPDEVCLAVLARVQSLCRAGLSDNVNGRIENQCDAHLAAKMLYTPVSRLTIEGPMR